MSFNSISDELLNAICRRSRLFEIFIIETCIKFSLIFFGTAKKARVIKTIEMPSLLLLINNLVAVDAPW